MRNESPLLAKRYAQAMVNVFGHQLNEQVVQQMDAAASFLRAHGRVDFFLAISAISEEKKRAVLVQLARSYNLELLIEPLIDLLLEHKRSMLLGPILAAIKRLYEQQHNSIFFTISSSHELSDDQLAHIVSFLKQGTGAHIRYEYKRDNQLIAGLRLQSQTYIWEHSMYKQLRALRVALMR